MEDQSQVPHKSPANPLTHNVPPSQSWLSFGMLHHLLCHSDTGTNTKRRAGGKIGVFFWLMVSEVCTQHWLASLLLDHGEAEHHGRMTGMLLLWKTGSRGRKEEAR